VRTFASSDQDDGRLATETPKGENTHTTHRRERRPSVGFDEQTANLVRGDWRDPRSGRITIRGSPRLGTRLQTRMSYPRFSTRTCWPAGRFELRRVEHGHVAAWAAEVATTSTPSTTRKALGALRSILDLAVRDRRIATNPALGVTLPRLPMSEQRFLTASELDALADAMPSERDAVLTLVLGWTGIRFGEGAAIRVESIDPLRRRIRIAEAIAEVRGRIVAGTPKFGVRVLTVFPSPPRGESGALVESARTSTRSPPIIFAREPRAQILSSPDADANQRSPESPPR
jgi:hypothetical protein